MKIAKRFVREFDKESQRVARADETAVRLRFDVGLWRVLIR